MKVKDIERDLKIILILVVLVGCYVLLNKNYVKGVNACIQKGYDVSYCEYHASK